MTNKRCLICNQESITYFDGYYCKTCQFEVFENLKDHSIEMAFLIINNAKIIAVRGDKKYNYSISRPYDIKNILTTKKFDIPSHV